MNVHWYWPSNNHLLWQNDYEIYSWKNNQAEELILRVSEPITGFAWHPQRNYLIYSNQEAIFLSFNEGGKTKNLKILQATQINSLFLDASTKLLYFKAQIDQQTGIFKLFVQ